MPDFVLLFVYEEGIGFMVNWMVSLLIVGMCIIIALILYIRRLSWGYKVLQKNVDIIEEKFFQYKRVQKDKINYLEYMLRQYEYFDTSLMIFNFDKAVKILKNKHNELYLVMESYRKNSLDFYFSGYSHKGISGCPRILTKVVKTHIWIEDIFAIDEDCGNGTLLLECLFNKAKELKIDTIKGELSPRDYDKFDKLEHFYKKNGFDVYFNQERTKGLIERNFDYLEK